MIELIQLQLANGAASVTCPEGKRIRIVSILASVSGAVTGDVLFFELYRGQDLIAAAIGTMVESNCARAAAMIHVSTPQLLNQSNVDPATGAVSYFACEEAALELPDLWLNQDCRVILGMATGIVGAGTVLYERADA